VLANSDVIRRRLAMAIFEYEGRRGDSMVIVGEKGDDPLLGATTLEGFGLVLDPFRRELRPMKLPLKRFSRSGRGAAADNNLQVVFREGRRRRESH
jgi:hypothetical protein